MLRRFIPISFFVIVATFASACATASGGGAPLEADTCHQTVAERCAKGGCDTFETASTRARKPQPGALARYEIGTCGDYRFVHEQAGAGDGTSYFDADGNLFAQTSIADAPICKGSFGASAGTVPSCKHVVTESHDWSQEH